MGAGVLVAVGDGVLVGAGVLVAVGVGVALLVLIPVPEVTETVSACGNAGADAPG